jgi:hypothetical protein
MRRCRNVWAALAVAGLALCLAAPAEAAKGTKAGKHWKAVAASATHAGKHRRAAAAAPRTSRYQGGVLAGPLYNGQDYLGDDPDPNIRSFLIRDKSRYGGVD